MAKYNESLNMFIINSNQTKLKYSHKSLSFPQSNFLSQIVLPNIFPKQLTTIYGQELLSINGGQLYHVLNSNDFPRSEK